MRWLGSLGLLVTFGGLFAGCSDRLPTYPVDGRVVFPSGSPVRVGTVEFRSREHGVQARGSIDTDGRFELMTYSPGDGAVAGVHDCVVVQMIIAEDIPDHQPSTLGVIDRRFASYSTSDLKVEIESDGPNQVELVVEGIRGFSSNHDDHDHDHGHDQTP